MSEKPTGTPANVFDRLVRVSWKIGGRPRSPEEITEMVRKGQQRLETVGCRLAALGWVTPMHLTPAEMYRIADAKTAEAIDRRFVELYESDAREEFNRLVRGRIFVGGSRYFGSASRRTGVGTSRSRFRRS